MTDWGDVNPDHRDRPIVAGPKTEIVVDLSADKKHLASDDRHSGESSQHSVV